jgi:uncharacterized protein YxeA
MKKIYATIAVIVLVVLGSLVAFKNAPKEVNANIGFKTTTLTNSGSNKACTINAYSYSVANYYMELGDSVTLTLTGIKDGGNYSLLIKKTVSGVCTLTNSNTIVGTTSPISLSGSTNSYFWVNFTKVGSTIVLLKQ